MNLAAELKAAANRVEQRHLDRMAGLVSAEALATLQHYDTHIAVAEVEEVSGFYAPIEGAPLHFITPVRVAGELIDLIAWRPARPDKWLLRTGAAWALGEDHAIGDWDGALDLHARPLDWLRAAGSGLCVLDWNAADVRQLANVQTVRVSNPAVGRTLITALSRPARLPTIETMEARLAA
ncbi:hypothetical protein ACFSCW_03300 [Sphingomonas tabacisoli]|uniref:Uncharacterized protein n=1 Tax=Sphingomonas tabacisoli TaxID=2249466 RepID=A0ABW4HYZ3_9SPHN